MSPADTGDVATADGLEQSTNIGQRAAVAAVMRLIGEFGGARFVPSESEDEVWFVLPDRHSSAGLRDAEQILNQLLGRKVWIGRDSARYEFASAFPARQPAS